MMKTLAAVVATAVLSSWLTWALTSGGPGSGAGAPAAAADTDPRVVELLERIASRLEQAPPPGPSRQSPARVAADEEEPVATPVPDERVADLLDAIAEEGRLTREALARLGGVNVRSVDEVRQRFSTPNQSALERFEELYRIDDDAARKSVVLLTVSELIARFGSPDEAHGNTRGFYMAWYRPGGKGEEWLAVTTADGMVTNAWCDLTD